MSASPAEAAALAAENLSKRLKSAGSGVDPSRLARLLAGAAAAPWGEYPDAWMALVGSPLDDALRDSLRRARA